MKHYFVLLVAVLFALGCVSQPNETSTFKIGGAFALSGFATEWGQEELNGALLAIEEANTLGGAGRKKIELVTEDVGSDNAKSVSAVLKLIDVDKVDIILGPSWLDTFGAATPLSDEHKVLMITSSSAITAINSEQMHPYVFSTWYRPDYEFADLTTYISENNTKISLFFDNTPYWQDVANQFRINAGQNGAEIVLDERFLPDETDFRTALVKGKDRNATAIVFGLNGGRTLLSFLKQRNDLYPESRLYTGEYIEEFLAQKEYEGLTSGITYVAPDKHGSDFSDKYKQRFGKYPVFAASNSYDATNMVIQALENDKTTPDEIRQYWKTTTFDTVTFGTVTFDELNGIVGGKFVIKQSGGGI